MSSTSLQNPVATITNNLGFDVDIYDVYNNNASLQGPLTYTKLATVASGSQGQQVQTIRFACQLQAMRTGNITALNNNYYQQFPVAVLPVLGLSSAAQNTFTLTSAMQQGMEESFQFIKYVQANPASVLAKDFSTALGTSPQEASVNKFFQGTGSFQQCTLSSWSAVTSWQIQFTSAWQGTYYLYSGGNSNGGAQATPPALVAVLAIGGTAQDTSAVLTMSGTNDQNTPVVMVGDGTMQEQNEGTGSLSVALTPTWMNIAQNSQQNGQTVVTYAIGAAFIGTISGVKVAGNLNQLALPDPSDASQNASDKSAAYQFTLSSLMSLLGLLAPVGMLYYQIKSYYDAKNQKQNDVEANDKDAAQAAADQQAIDQAYEQSQVPVVQNGLENIPDSGKVDVAANEYYEARSAVNIIDGVGTAEEELLAQMEIKPPSAEEVAAAVELGDAEQNLINTITDPNTSEAALNAAVANANTNVAEAGDELGSELANAESTLDQAQVNADKDAVNISDQITANNEAAAEAEQERTAENEAAAGEPVNEQDFDDPMADPEIGGEF